MMPSRKDELAERRFTKLVEHLRAMIAANLKPEYHGFYGQLLITRDEITELGELAEVRKAARAAGRQLNWKVRTHLSEDGTLLVIDDREAPQEIRMLAAHRAANAVAAVITDAQNQARMRRTSQPSTLPGQPNDPDHDL